MSREAAKEALRKMTSVYATWREAPYRPVVRRYTVTKIPKGLKF